MHAFHAFLEKVRGQIRSNRATKQKYLIRLLNPVIRGLGILSPSHRSGVGVSESGDGPLELALAMGKAPASEQVRYLDRRSILAPAWTAFMVLRRDDWL